MSGVGAVNLGVRFVLELCALAALAVFGWQVSDRVVLQLLLAAAAPLVAAVVWGQWVAPRARSRLDDPARLGVEVLVFAAGVGGLLVVGHPGWAVVLGVAYAVNVSLGFALHQRAR